MNYIKTLILIANFFKVFGQDMFDNSDNMIDSSLWSNRIKRQSNDSDDEITNMLLWNGVNNTGPTWDSWWKNLPQDCGRSLITSNKDKSSRIVGGNEAKIGQFPFMARLGITNPISKDIWFICGGSLISRFYVVSAAHCLETPDMVRLGDHDTETDVDCDSAGNCALPHQDINIKSRVFDDYCALSHDNDFLLLELERPAELNDYVQPICLPRNPIPLTDLVGKVVVISGWGYTRTPTYKGASTAKVLMYVHKQIIDNPQCRVELDFEYSYVGENNLCVGGNAGMSACRGDSGGPAILYAEVNGEKLAYLIGIVSYGTFLCESGITVFSYTPYFMTKILENIKKS